MDGLIKNLLGDQAGQGGGEGIVGEILLKPGAQPLLDSEGEEPAEDVPVFFLQVGQDLFLLEGQQVLQSGAGCLGLLRGDGAALGIQCFLGTGEELGEQLLCEDGLFHSIQFMVDQKRQRITSHHSAGALWNRRLMLGVRLLRLLFHLG